MYWSSLNRFKVQNEIEAKISTDILFIWIFYASSLKLPEPGLVPKIALVLANQPVSRKRSFDQITNVSMIEKWNCRFVPIPL